MKFLKPKFWENRNSIYSIVLYPISIIIQFTTMLKRILIIPKKFKIPIICVGNIYLGGTGKTPVSIEIVNGRSERILGLTKDGTCGCCRLGKSCSW